MTRNKIYFISDCHIGAGYIPDRKAHERRIAKWVDTAAADASHIFLLGDILDYWFEYRDVVPRGYTRFFGALSRAADAGVKITWMRGNHDIWLFDYLRDEIGLDVADGVIERTIGGKRFVMAHGDGIGHQSHTFTFLRALFRNRIAQRLYAAIHPWFTVGFAHRWSTHNRMHGKAEQTEHLQPDDRYIVFADEYSKHSGRADFFIFGHRHIVIDQPGPDDSRIIVLGDAFNRFTYGVYDPAKGFAIEAVPEL